MTFKTQAQIFQALLDSKTLVYKNDVEVRLVDGLLQSKSKATKNLWSYDFDYPEQWSIKKELLVRWEVRFDGKTYGWYINEEDADLAVKIHGGCTIKFIEAEET